MLPCLDCRHETYHDTIDASSGVGDAAHRGEVVSRGAGRAGQTTLAPFPFDSRHVEGVLSQREAVCGRRGGKDLTCVVSEHKRTEDKAPV